MAQKISQMTEQTTASMTETGTSDFLGGYTTTGGNANRKFSLSGLANYFLNKFKMTLGGSSQTVKSAIDTLNSNSPKILFSANMTNGSSREVSVEEYKVYLLACSHPFVKGGIAVICYYGSGPYRINWIGSEPSVVSVSVANNKLSISTSDTMWVKVIDLGGVL